MNCFYNGVKLPALPSGLGKFVGIYKNHYLTDDEKENGVYYYLVAHESQHYFANSDDVYPDTLRGKWYYGSENGSPRAVVYRMREQDSDWTLTEQTAWNIRVQTGWVNFDVVWTNFTLYMTSNGEYRYTIGTPSDPIPINPQLTLMGYMVGQSIGRIRPYRQPIGCLYLRSWRDGDTSLYKYDINGVLYRGLVLPPLPEWDKEAYPYAYLYANNRVFIEGIFIVCEKPVTAKTNDYADAVIGSKYMEWIYDRDTKSWVFDLSYSFVSTYYQLKKTYIDWINKPIYNEDGTVFMDASPDPTTAYEGTLW